MTKRKPVHGGGGVMMAAETPMDRRNRHGSRCTATNRQGQRCGRWASRGRTTCSNHGGTQPIGVASSNFVHGGYAKLPGPIHKEYLASKADPNFLSVAEELHALRALAGHLAGGLGLDVVAVRREVGAAWDSFLTAKAGGNVVRMKEAMASLERTIDDARQMTTKINELIVMFDNIRKLSDTETKRVVLAKEMLTREQAQLFAGLVQAAVVEAIGVLADPRDRQKVLAAFTDNMVRIQVGGLR